MSTATVTHNLPIAEALVNTKPKGLVKIQVQWIPTLFSGLKAPFEKPGLGVCCRVVCSCVQALRAVSVFDPRGNLVVGMGRESCPTFPSTPPPPLPTLPNPTKELPERERAPRLSTLSPKVSLDKLKQKIMIVWQ